MKVTFGIVNCNRLHYLKACVESIFISTSDYDNKEIIVVDNASIEPGTEEYLKSLASRGVNVIQTTKRDPSNEFARALNTIVKESTGDVICPLSGDLQFVLSPGWIKPFLKIVAEKQDLGSLMLDSQRRKTIVGNTLESPVFYEEMKFWKNTSRPPIATSGNSFYRREVLEKLGPWSEDNKNHEGTDDSETKMLKRVVTYCVENKVDWSQYQSCFPATVMITTDPRGTNARIRGEKVYGKYVEGKGDSGTYYKFRSIEELQDKYGLHVRDFPLEIEKVAIGEGFDIYLDRNGDWKKSPIRVEDCNPEDWSYIDPEMEKRRQANNIPEDYLKDWMESE